MNELYHHGILGMKWGVRRYQNEDGSLTPEGKKKYAKSITNGNITLAGNNRKGTYQYHILKKQQKVGNVYIDDEGDTDHLDWIGISNRYRRKGYGQEALDLIIQDSINRGKKYLTLEAAGLDQAAEHIYKKKGFEAVKQVDADIWDGLIYMRKDLTK